MEWNRGVLSCVAAGCTDQGYEQQEESHATADPVLHVAAAITSVCTPQVSDIPIGIRRHRYPTGVLGQSSDVHRDGYTTHDR
jgi:hypothetical protein